MNFLLPINIWPLFRLLTRVRESLLPAAHSPLQQAEPAPRCRRCSSPPFPPAVSPIRRSPAPRRAPRRRGQGRSAAGEALLLVPVPARTRGKLRFEKDQAEGYVEANHLPGQQSVRCAGCT